jgi:hypothetical protein
MMTMSGDPGPPEFPPEEELRRIEAEVVIHGSQAVLAELELLSGQTRTFQIDVMMLRSTRERGSRAAGETITTWQKVEADRVDARKTVTRLLGRMSRELREERPL